MKIIPARRLCGRVRVPGDKSISHRAGIIAALATGTSRITNFSPSQDCQATLSCLRQLGVSVKTEGNNLQITGGGLRPTRDLLDCGNSGSTIRMLAGVLAGQNFSSTLTGDSSLLSRPMQRIVEPLRIMGAEVTSVDGKPPLRIDGVAPLIPIRYELPIASAQVKSCVLLAGLHAKGRTEVIERHNTRDHTERMLKWFGVPLQSTEQEAASVISIDGLQNFQARDVSIPGDISSAAFLIAASALCPDSDLELDDVGTNPTRTRFLSVLQSWGLQIKIANEHAESNEPRGSIQVRGKADAAPAHYGNARVLRGRMIAELIDELPLLTVVGTQIPGGIEIRDAGELRFKESDRIGATVTNLQAMGAEIVELEDGLRVWGPRPLRGAKLDSFGDHRIAMAFAVAALIAEGSSEIVGADCVGVSFPDFFETLDSVVER